MPRHTERPMTRICVRLWTDNLAFLQAQASADFGFNEIVRTVIDKYCTAAQGSVRARVDARAPDASTDEHQAALNAIIADIREATTP